MVERLPEDVARSVDLYDMFSQHDDSDYTEYVRGHETLRRLARLGVLGTTQDEVYERLEQIDNDRRVAPIRQEALSELKALDVEYPPASANDIIVMVSAHEEAKRAEFIALIQRSPYLRQAHRIDVFLAGDDPDEALAWRSLFGGPN